MVRTHREVARTDPTDRKERFATTSKCHGSANVFRLLLPHRSLEMFLPFPLVAVVLEWGSHICTGNFEPCTTLSPHL